MLSYISYPIIKYIDFREKKRQKLIRRQRFIQINKNCSVKTPVLASYMIVSSHDFISGEKIAWGLCHDDLDQYGIDHGVSYYSSQSHHGPCWYFYLTFHTQEDISLMQLLFPGTNLLFGDDIKMGWE